MGKGLLNASQRRILGEALGPNVEIAALDRVMNEVLRLARMDHAQFRGLIEGTHRIIPVTAREEKPIQTKETIASRNARRRSSGSVEGEV